MKEANGLGFEYGQAEMVLVRDFHVCNSLWGYFRSLS